MANKENRVEENVSGKFYVDDQCVGCDMCRTLAPEFFEMNDNGNSYVKRQPTTPEEEQLCNEALESCPVEAIGDDGDA